jgi:AhpD family alkylhydroperoxidase
MTVIQVFDPPMCCSTGVCGPDVDPVLPRFAADLEWLTSRGVDVQRFNLSQEPQAFAGNELVMKALREVGNEVLPMILKDGSVASQGRYPTREELAKIAGITEAGESLMTDAVGELVALGAAIASNCEPCFKFHFDKARKLGVSRTDMRAAVSIALDVKAAPARNMVDLADRYLDERPIQAVQPKHLVSTGCCGSSTAGGNGGAKSKSGGCC